MIGSAGEVVDEILQLRIRGGGREAVVRGVVAMVDDEIAAPSGFASVEVGDDVGKGDVVGFPMHITREMRDSKTPKGEFISSHFESQIRLGPMPQWDNAVHANGGDFREAIWIDRIVGIFPDERHRDVRIHHADDVRDEHGPVREVNAEIGGACFLFPAMNNCVGDENNSIGQQKISAEVGEGLFLHEKIRRGQGCFHSESCRIVPIAPGFGGQVRAAGRISLRRRRADVLLGRVA